MAARLHHRDGRPRPGRPDDDAACTTDVDADGTSVDRRDHLDVGTTARRHEHVPPGHVGRGDDVVAVDGHDPVGGGRPDRGGALVRVDDPYADAGSCRHHDPLVPGGPVQRVLAGIQVQDRDDIGHPPRRTAGRIDDERPEQPTLDLLVGDLVRVVPVGAWVGHDEPVDVAPPDRHRVLRHTGHAVLRVRHVDTVPVDRRARGDRLVDEGHLEELALARPDRRTR